MSARHGDAMGRLTRMLHLQLDRDQDHVRAGHARLRRSADMYYVPDVAVIPSFCRTSTAGAARLARRL
jgi:hypothetical protein